MYISKYTVVIFSPKFAFSKFRSSIHPIFHVILAEERLRIYTGFLLLETFISTSNKPRLLSTTDLNVCVCLEVLSGITMSPARTIMFVCKHSSV